MSDGSKRTVVVAGASGFVGRGLPQVFGDDYELIGLSRDPRKAATITPAGYRWRRCDLFSRRQAHEALAGADAAVYLVHSMIPSADLSQGDIADMDLICADNFARAADAHGVEHIVYVAELIGDGCEAISGRCGDIETVLGAYEPSVTTLRAGFVIGPGGAGIEMLFRLVERLPVMMLPSWVSSNLVPIARSDLVRLISFALANRQSVRGSFDVGGSERTSFRGMLGMVAQLMGCHRRFFRVPVETPRLSARWISAVTGQPYPVVLALVQRLGEHVEPTDRRLQEMAGQRPMPIADALREGLRGDEPRGKEAPPVPVTQRETGLSPTTGDVSVVRSVQRVVLPRGRDVRWVAEEYARWLPKFMGPLIRARVDESGTVRFFLWRLSHPLLVLELDHEVSESDRQLFWISGGLLVAPEPMARLEFRRIPTRRAVLTAIHRYRPRLPWLIYLFTQAQFHHFVMRSFGRYLERIDYDVSRRRTVP